MNKGGSVRRHHSDTDDKHAKSRAVESERRLNRLCNTFPAIICIIVGFTFMTVLLLGSPKNTYHRYVHGTNDHSSSSLFVDHDSSGRHGFHTRDMNDVTNIGTGTRSSEKGANVVNRMHRRSIEDAPQPVKSCGSCSVNCGEGGRECCRHDSFPSTSDPSCKRSSTYSPCDDFYSYSCDEFSKDNTLSGKKGMDASFWFAKREVERDVKKLMDAMLDMEHQSSPSRLREMFYSCKNTLHNRIREDTSETKPAATKQRSDPLRDLFHVKGSASPKGSLLGDCWGYIDSLTTHGSVSRTLGEMASKGMNFVLELSVEPHPSGVESFATCIKPARSHRHISREDKNPVGKELYLLATESCRLSPEKWGEDGCEVSMENYNSVVESMESYHPGTNEYQLEDYRSYARSNLILGGVDAEGMEELFFPDPLYSEVNNANYEGVMPYKGLPRSWVNKEGFDVVELLSRYSGFMSEDGNSKTFQFFKSIPLWTPNRKHTEHLMGVVNSAPLESWRDFLRVKMIEIEIDVWNVSRHNVHGEARYGTEETVRLEDGNSDQKMEWHRGGAMPSHLRYGPSETPMDDASLHEAYLSRRMDILDELYHYSTGGEGAKRGRPITKFSSEIDNNLLLKEGEVDRFCYGLTASHAWDMLDLHYKYQRDRTCEATTEDGSEERSSATNSMSFLFQSLKSKYEGEISATKKPEYSEEFVSWATEKVGSVVGVFGYTPNMERMARKVASEGIISSAKDTFAESVCKLSMARLRSSWDCASSVSVAMSRKRKRSQRGGYERHPHFVEWAAYFRGSRPWHLPSIYYSHQRNAVVMTEGMFNRPFLSGGDRCDTVGMFMTLMVAHELSHALDRTGIEHSFDGTPVNRTQVSMRDRMLHEEELSCLSAAYGSFSLTKEGFADLMSIRLVESLMEDFQRRNDSSSSIGGINTRFCSFPLPGKEEHEVLAQSMCHTKERLDDRHPSFRLRLNSMLASTDEFMTQWNCAPLSSMSKLRNTLNKCSLFKR